MRKRIQKTPTWSGRFSKQISVVINKQHENKKKIERPCKAPWGIQDIQTKSLLFRLLDVVLIPITIKYFLDAIVGTSMYKKHVFILAEEKIYINVYILYDKVLNCRYLITIYIRQWKRKWRAESVLILSLIYFPICSSLTG